MKTFYTLLILLIPFVGISQTVYVTNTYDSGPGSLRDAVINATDGTTIRFDESINNQTITLTSNLTSTANIRIVGNADDQTSLGIKFDNSFFSYGELIIDSIDIHPNSLQDFVFFHIYNDFQFINSYASNIESSAKIFSIQSENSDININIQNSSFINIPGKLFYLNSPNINFDLSFCYGNNINTFIDDFILNGSSDISISYSEFNNSKIITNTAIEKLEILSSTFNNFDVENSYAINVENYFDGNEMILDIDSVNFSNSNIKIFNNIYESYANLDISNSTFNSGEITFCGFGNLNNVNINNFEYLKFGLLNIYNSNISSDGSQYSQLGLYFDDLNYDIDLLFENTNIYNQISVNGSQQTTSVTFNNCYIAGNLYSDNIDNLIFNNCTFKDNDDFTFLFDNDDCSMCKTYINSCYFNNNQGGYYSMNYMINQIGGNLEINNSTFYDNDNVIYFNSGLKIDINSTTFYQNDICLNLDQWLYQDETGSIKFYNSIVGNIDFAYGSSIIAEGYNIFSNSLSNLSETNFDDVSDLNLTLIEDNSSVTPYLLADYCSIAHDNGDPNFEGSIVNTEVPVNIKDIGSAERTDICDENEISWNCNNEYACIELSDGSGIYQTLEECEANCSVVIEDSWNCINDDCVEPMDGSGMYGSLNDCEANCSAVIEDSWNCINDACVDPLDGSGEFSTLNDCEQECTDVTSINENIIDVNIYPNPSSNIFNLEFDSDYGTEIIVTNILGEQVYFESIQSNGEFNTQIDLSNYSKGIYNLTIQTSDGISNHKLILQ
jgi:hypothetical protein